MSNRLGTGDGPITGFCPGMLATGVGMVMGTGASLVTGVAEDSSGEMMVGSVGEGARVRENVLTLGAVRVGSKG